MCGHSKLFVAQTDPGVLPSHLTIQFSIELFIKMNTYDLGTRVMLTLWMPN